MINMRVLPNEISSPRSDDPYITALKQLMSTFVNKFTSILESKSDILLT